MESGCLIREIRQEEIEQALDLVWRVFQAYEAPGDTKEDTEAFYKSIHDETYLSGLCWYGAFIREALIGVLAVRNEGAHIALFFVDGKYHRQGIGKRLYQVAQAANHSKIMTVNASPYAVPIYHKLGFRDTGTEQVVNGLRFTPMERTGEEGSMEDCAFNLRPFLDEAGRLTALPAKHKKKLPALWYLAGKLEAGRQYTEQEINALLDEWTCFHDPASLRRELYNKRLLNRTADGKCYWRAEALPELEAFIKAYAGGGSDGKL